MTQTEIREEFYRKNILENRSKALLSSTDILDSNEFAFSAVCPGGRVGDSGPLLLAQRRADASCRLLVKHARLHTAANEYVYSKLALAMGCAVPRAFLFQAAPDDRGLFETDFVTGSVYLENATASPTFAQIRDQAANWQDYFRLHALFCMFLDDDGFEALLGGDHRVYRIDTADAFGINEFQILAAADISYLSFTTRRRFIENWLLRDLRPRWEQAPFDAELHYCAKLDEAGRPCYLEPFDRIQAIPQTYIDDFLDVLCRFYPDLLGDYYKRFIVTLQGVARDYLKAKG